MLDGESADRTLWQPLASSKHFATSLRFNGCKSSARAGQSSPCPVPGPSGDDDVDVDVDGAAQATDLLLLNWRSGQLRCNLVTAA